MIKKIIISSLVIGFFSILCFADNHQAQFDRANQLYEESQYDQALQLYLQLEKDVVNWKLLFNIGNCYYKQNQFVKAKIYYLRAQRLQPFETSIQKNIDSRMLRTMKSILLPE